MAKWAYSWWVRGTVGALLLSACGGDGGGNSSSGDGDGSGVGGDSLQSSGGAGAGGDGDDDSGTGGQSTGGRGSSSGGGDVDGSGGLRSSGGQDGGGARDGSGGAVIEGMGGAPDVYVVDDSILENFPGKCGSAIDRDGDGVFDSFYVNEYDEQGYEVGYHNATSDGTLTYLRYITRTPDGKSLESQHDTDADGVIDARYAHEYDSEGNLLRDVDYRADGTITRTRDYILDENGDFIQIIENMQEDGYGTSSMTYVRDANGCYVETLQDNGHDLVIEFYSTYLRDEDCNQLERKLDIDNDGSFEEITTSTFDAEGNELTSTLTYTNGDPGYSYVREFTNGEVTREVYTNSAGGTSVTTWERDSDGNILRVEVASLQGVLTEVRAYTRDSEGRDLVYVVDELADGQPDYVRLYFHDCPNAP